MPHFGLMSTADSFKTPEGALQRARLHIRAGKRRLRQGKISAGLLTLSDALSFAMRFFLKSPAGQSVQVLPDDDITDDRVAFAVLKRAGILDERFDFDTFDRLIEEAMMKELPDFDYRKVLEDIEHVMGRLGVMPFDEQELPPEDPSTF